MKSYEWLKTSFLSISHNNDPWKKIAGVQGKFLKAWLSFSEFVKLYLEATLKLFQV